MTSAARKTQARRPKPEGKPLHVADGTLEAIKWLALALMTADHVNKYLFAGTLPGVYQLGRLALPMFAFVLAYNLARPSALTNGAYQRTMVRLAVTGTAATPFFMMLGGLLLGWWPLNILFTLFVAASTLYLVQQGNNAYRLAGIITFVIGGAIVEFWWFGVVFCMCAHWYCKTTNRKVLLAWTVAAISLSVVNRNIWAVASIPIILLVSNKNINVPRFQRLFYVYYPAHLALIFIINYFQ